MFSKFKKLCCRTADVIDNSYPENEINIMKDDNIERSKDRINIKLFLYWEQAAHQMYIKLKI